VLEEAAAWIEEKNAENIAINEAEAAAQEEAGIEVIAFTGETAEEWLETAQSAGWAAIEDIDAETAAELKACLVE
jgi:aspartate/glutamate racemase